MIPLIPKKSPRSTKQRHAIKESFSKEHRPLSPREILEIASKSISNLGIATVYRNIKIMVDQKELIIITIPGQADRYYLPTAEKRPIFLCTKTNKAYFLDPKSIKTQVHNLPTHFHVHHAETIVYGECND